MMRKAVIVTALSGLLLAMVGCGDGGGGGTAASCSANATKRTVQYASIAGVDPNLLSLDVYQPASTGSCTKKPIVIWVHGGGWSTGDKSEYMEYKVPLFNDAGYVFVSVNYQLTIKTDPANPHPQWPVHDQDTADAVAWVIHHASEFGADPHKVALLGHSAGGGIVAAISADPRYLGKNDLKLDAIRCSGSMDGEGYDIVAGATTSPPEWQPTYTAAFGTDPAVWETASPIRYVAAGKGIPDYFIAARGIDWRLAQHVAWYDALENAGVPTTVLDTRELEHTDLTTVIGQPGDTIVTPALMDFLGGCFSR
jgi:arylformamidase